MAKKSQKEKDQKKIDKLIRKMGKYSKLSIDHIHGVGRAIAETARRYDYITLDFGRAFRGEEKLVVTLTEKGKARQVELIEIDNAAAEEKFHREMEALGRCALCGHFPIPGQKIFEYTYIVVCSNKECVASKHSVHQDLWSAHSKMQRI
jgi:hypothetical protein